MAFRRRVAERMLSGRTSLSLNHEVAVEAREEEEEEEEEEEDGTGTLGTVPETKVSRGDRGGTDHLEVGRVPCATQVRGEPAAPGGHRAG